MRAQLLSIPCVFVALSSVSRVARLATGWNYPATGTDTTPAVDDVPLSSRLWKWGMDRIYRPVYNRLMDRDGTRTTSYATILGWDFEYLAPAHGEPVALAAKDVLRKHLNILADA